MLIKSVAVLIATSMIALSTTATAQSAPAGMCQIFRDFDYKTPMGNVVGNQKSGDAVIFADQASAPKNLVEFLEKKVGYRVFYDKKHANSLSSVKVGKGCTAEFHNSLSVQQGSVMPFATYTSDTPQFSAANNDKAQMVICRCAK